MRGLYTTGDVGNKSVGVTIVACPFCCLFRRKGNDVMFDKMNDDVKCVYSTAGDE